MPARSPAPFCRPDRCRTKSTVLVIENDPDVRVMLEVLLHRSGFEVVTSPTAKGAFARAGGRQLAAVLVIAGVPDLDEPEFAARLRSCTSCVVAMTRDGDPEGSGAECLERLGCCERISRTQVLSRAFADGLLQRLGES